MARNRRMKTGKLIPHYQSGLILVQIIVGRMKSAISHAASQGGGFHPPYDRAAEQELCVS